MSDESALFRALADETRRQILSLLSRARLPVGDLAAEFPDISRPAVSKHLRILRQAGLVSETRHGRRRLYRLERDRLAPIGLWLATIEDEFPRPSSPAPEPSSPRVGQTAARRRKARVAVRPKRGVRPLRRDEPEADDWRSW